MNPMLAGAVIGCCLLTLSACTGREMSGRSQSDQFILVRSLIDSLEVIAGQTAKGQNLDSDERRRVKGIAETALTEISHMETEGKLTARGINDAKAELLMVMRVLRIYSLSEGSERK